jgi:hypothetical protein
MARLPRLDIFQMRESSCPLTVHPMRRVASPPGRSTLMTSAPKSAR